LITAGLTAQGCCANLEIVIDGFEFDNGLSSLLAGAGGVFLRLFSFHRMGEDKKAGDEPAKI
jgi:hypothetical protein